MDETHPQLKKWKKNIQEPLKEKAFSWWVPWTTLHLSSSQEDKHSNPVIFFLLIGSIFRSKEQEDTIVVVAFALISENSTQNST